MIFIEYQIKKLEPLIRFCYKSKYLVTIYIHYNDY